MANTIQLKRSAVAGKVPLVTDLQLGEVAINTCDGKMYMKRETAVNTCSITEIYTSNSSGIKVTSLCGGNNTTLLGSIPYQSNTDTTTLLAPNTTATKQFLTQTGTGTNGAAPAWYTITKSDVGLGNVENTALSTWAGSTNITTIGAATATSLVVSGNLTVNGTTSTINSTTITVDDINIELGSVTTPTDATANGGGITLKGATDKTIVWDNINANWTSSENWNLATGKTYKINNTNVLSNTTLGSTVVSSSLTGVGTVTTGTWCSALGAVTAAGLTVNASLVVNAASAGVEIGSQSASNTPYIDFHSSGNLIDYDSRIIASGGTTSVGNGVLTHIAGTHVFQNASSQTALQITSPASTINSWNMAGSATGGNLTLTASGGDAAIGLSVKSKGASSIALGNDTGSGFGIWTPASAVNYFVANGQTTGNGPSLNVQGTDANIAAYVQSKGTYPVTLGSNNGNGLLVYAPTASTVNYVQIIGTATGSAPSLAAAGSDTNVALSVQAKGTGNILFSNNTGTSSLLNLTGAASTVNYIQLAAATTGNAPVYQAAGTDTNIDLAFVAKGTNSVWLKNTSGTAFQAQAPASGVNYLLATGAAAAGAPNLSAQGSDTNISMLLTPKGSGSVAISQADQSTRLAITNSSSTASRWPGVNITNYTGGLGGFPVIELTTARGTGAAPTSVVNGDVLGGFNTWGYNGTSSISATRIQGTAEATFSTAVTAGLDFLTTNAGTQARGMYLSGAGTLTVTGGIGLANSFRYTASLTTSTTSASQVVGTLSATTYRTVKAVAQITSGTSYHSTELLILHDGTNANVAEYGYIYTGVSLGTFSADVSGGNVRLLFSPVNAVNTVKVDFLAINI